MFTETLFGNTEKALALLGKSRLLAAAYLAGGTACALQLGHRISVDLDFFTPTEFDAKQVILSLQKVGDFQLEQESWGTILGTLEGIRFSLFVYKYPALYPFHSFQGIQIADLRDIAAMKIDAISSRGIKRDFVDLYFICQSGITLAEILRFYDRKYGALSSNEIHVLKSLVYFADAEASEMPKMIKEMNWAKVKAHFESQVRKLFNFQ